MGRLDLRLNLSQWRALLARYGSRLARMVRSGAITKERADALRREELQAKELTERKTRSRFRAYLEREARGDVGCEAHSYLSEVRSYQARFRLSLLEAIDRIPFREPWHDYWSAGFLAEEAAFRERIDNLGKGA